MATAPAPHASSSADGAHRRHPRGIHRALRCGMPGLRLRRVHGDTASKENGDRTKKMMLFLPSIRRGRSWHASTDDLVVRFATHDLLVVWCGVGECAYSIQYLSQCFIRQIHSHMSARANRRFIEHCCWFTRWFNSACVMKTVTPARMAAVSGVKPMRRHPRLNAAGALVSVARAYKQNSLLQASLFSLLFRAIMDIAIARRHSRSLLESACTFLQFSVHVDWLFAS